MNSWVVRLLLMCHSDVYMDHINRKSSIDMLVSLVVVCCIDCVADCCFRCWLQEDRLVVNSSSSLLDQGQTSVLLQTSESKSMPSFLFMTCRQMLIDMIRLAEPERGQSTLTFRAS